MSGIDVKVISVLLPSYQIIRLGAYWNQIEPESDCFLLMTLIGKSRLRTGWKTDYSIIEKEAEAVRKADPDRLLLMNGFLPTSLPVRISQWWQTRDQGDSLALAMRLAVMVGIDYYPRNALVRIGRRTLYLDGSHGAQEARGRNQLLDWSESHGRRLLVTEGQAEPWETVTTPPNPGGQGMYSCLPEHLITNYNVWLSTTGERLPFICVSLLGS